VVAWWRLGEAGVGSILIHIDKFVRVLMDDKPRGILPVEASF